MCSKQKRRNRWIEAIKLLRSGAFLAQRQTVFYKRENKQNILL